VFKSLFRTLRERLASGYTIEQSHAPVEHYIGGIQEGKGNTRCTIALRPIRHGFHNANFVLPITHAKVHGFQNSWWEKWDNSNQQPPLL
jgi:hypothetical protein